MISILSAIPMDCLKKKVCLSICFSAEKKFSAIFDFHFRKNPRFRDEFQAMLLRRCLLVDNESITEIRQGPGRFDLNVDAGYTEALQDGVSCVSHKGHILHKTPKYV